MPRYKPSRRRLRSRNQPAVIIGAAVCAVILIVLGIGLLAHAPPERAHGAQPPLETGEPKPHFISVQEATALVNARIKAVCDKTPGACAGMTSLTMRSLSVCEEVQGDALGMAKGREAGVSPQMISRQYLDTPSAQVPHSYIVEIFNQTMAEPLDSNADDFSRRVYSDCIRRQGLDPLAAH
jgi:hypothetical protein